jgi:hypothetical protein
LIRKWWRRFEQRPGDGLLVLQHMLSPAGQQGRATAGIRQSQIVGGHRVAHVEHAARRGAAGARAPGGGLTI